MEEPLKAASWMDKLGELDSNLLIYRRGVDICRSWTNRSADDARLDSLGHETAESIRVNANVR